MIRSRQIFVVYLPGTFGFMLGTILSKGSQAHFYSDGYSKINAHNSNYKNKKDMHSKQDAEAILAMNDEERLNFFKKKSTAIDIKDRIYCFSSFHFLDIPLHKYFKEYTMVIILPKSNIPQWAERHVIAIGQTKPEDMDAEIISKEQIMLKNIKKIPVIPNAIYFDPINFFDSDKIHTLVDQVYDQNKIEKIKIPRKRIEQHMEKSKGFFKTTVDK